MFEKEDYIYKYTREQAVEDGTLVDLSQFAASKMYKWPVACTASVWAIIENAVEHKEWGNDFEGVLHDMLWMSQRPTKKFSESSHLFKMIIFEGKQVDYTFKVLVGPGDDSRPVITIMLPDED